MQSDLMDHDLKFLYFGNKEKCREMWSTTVTSNRWCDFIDARIPFAQRCDYKNSSHFHIIINLKVFSVGVSANMPNATILQVWSNPSNAITVNAYIFDVSNVICYFDHATFI